MGLSNNGTQSIEDLLKKYHITLPYEKKKETDKKEKDVKKDVFYLYIIDSLESLNYLNEIYDILEFNEFLNVLALHHERDLEKKILFVALEGIMEDLHKIIEYNVKACNTQIPRLLIQEIRQYISIKEVDGIMISEKLKRTGEKISESTDIPLMTY